MYTGMRLLSLCCVLVIASAFPEKDPSSGRSYESEKVDARISGGQPANKDFFYQAQIIRESAPFCSGAVINPLYVLTAAHCVQDAKPQDVTVRFLTRRRGAAGSTVRIGEIVKHPEYDYPQSNFDIAYLKSRFPMNILPSYQAVRIFDVGTPLPREVTVSGFGYQGKEEDKLSDQLMFVKLPIISQMECQAFYPEKLITKNMICAHTNRDMGKGTCPGDGGDPAVDKESNRLIGISSFSRGCGPGQGPSVFTFIEAKEIHDFIVNGTKVDQKTKKPKPFQEKPDRPSTEEAESPSKEQCQWYAPKKSPSQERPDRPSKEQCQYAPKRKSFQERPHRPSTEESERTSKEKSEKPSKEKAEKSARFLPGRPADELPERPLEDVPGRPFEEEPERPLEEEPESPSDERPESLFEELPEASSEEKPDRPSDEIPESPFEELPDAPSEEKPERPIDEIPESPFEEQPEVPSEEKPERPADEIPERPFEEISERPFEGKP